jgi:plastocyanin
MSSGNWPFETIARGGLSVKRVALVLAVAGLGTSALAGPGFGASEASTAAVTINVTAVDFKFRLSKMSVPRGSVVTFKVVNKGKSPHDFDIPELRKGTKYLAKGKTATLKVTFNKAGSYRYVCTVPRHIQLGMDGRLRVK